MSPLVAVLAVGLLGSGAVGQVDTENGMPTTTPGPTVCKKDEAGPDFIPNIYECDSAERCCENEGAPSCCGTEVSNSALVEQAIMWGSLIGVFLVVGIVASCYFKDRYCCDREDGKGLFGGKVEEKYQKKHDISAVLYPEEVKANRVQDPIFGNTGTDGDVPQFATVDEETRQKAQRL